MSRIPKVLTKQVDNVCQDFTRAHYLSTLQRYDRNDWVIVRTGRDIANFAPEKRFLFLRHDVDFSPVAAHKLGMREASINVCSSFFIRLHSPNYNALAVENLCIWQALFDLGHSIGLHFEPELGPAWVGNDNGRLHRELQLLKGALGYAIKDISVHCASQYVMDNVFVASKRLNNVSLPVKNVKYISDSAGRWREGCFCEWVQTDFDLQVNTHPVWWYNDTPGENW